MSKKEKIQAIKAVLSPKKKAQLKIFVGDDPEPYWAEDTEDENDFCIRVNNVETAEALKRIGGHE